MNNEQQLESLKQQILTLSSTIGKIYSGEIKSKENTLQLVYELTCLNTEYKKLKSKDKY